MTPHRVAALLAVLALLASGCGGSSDPASTASGRSSTTSADPEQQLEAAVREAIRLDHRDAVRALWTNRVPERPAATGGPALVQWRRSTAAAREQGIRVRVLSERFRIVSVRLDPSYKAAVAIVHDKQRAQPTRLNGKPLGRPITLDERVRLELRRVGDGDRFVVWKVVALPR
jgi:hypothetical protein